MESGSADVSKHFLDAQAGLLRYGAYAAKLPLAVERVSFLPHCPPASIMLSHTRYT